MYMLPLTSLACNGKGLLMQSIRASSPIWRYLSKGVITYKDAISVSKGTSFSLCHKGILSTTNQALFNEAHDLQVHTAPDTFSTLQYR
jgi:hypothetical protein